MLHSSVYGAVCAILQSINYANTPDELERRKEDAIRRLTSMKRSGLINARDYKEFLADVEKNYAETRWFLSKNN